MAGWREKLHPRDNEGKFAKVPGTGGMNDLLRGSRPDSVYGAELNRILANPERREAIKRELLGLPPETPKPETPNPKPKRTRSTKPPKTEQVPNSIVFTTSDGAELDKLTKQQTDELGNRYQLISGDTLRSPTFNAGYKTLRTADDYVSKTFPDNPNRWNGKMRWSDFDEQNRHNAAFNPYSGTVDVAPWQMEERSGVLYPVLIHEMFHAHSPGDEDSYRYNRGYEEGLAEMMQRNHRKEILPNMPDIQTTGTENGGYPKKEVAPKMGKDKAAAVDKAAKAINDKDHVYNKYIDALEGIRKLTGDRNKKKFYDDLYKTPIERRSDYLSGKVQDALGKDASISDMTDADLAFKKFDRILRDG